MAPPDLPPLQLQGGTFITLYPGLKPWAEGSSPFVGAQASEGREPLQISSTRPYSPIRPTSRLISKKNHWPHPAEFLISV